MKHTCPVCGFPELTEAPQSKSGGGSFEICPSCGFQFGVSDDDIGFTYAKWRKAWRDAGMKWSSKQAPKKGWDPAKQLAALRKSPAKTKRGNA